VEVVHSSSGHRRLFVAGALALVAAALLGLSLLSSHSSAAAATCPSFRVLHNDRIGPASFPAGNYTLTPASGSGITCAGTTKLFARFLEDYDGVLPGGWRVSSGGSGRATFSRAGQAGFSVEPAKGGGGGGNRALGKLCPGTFTVQANTIIRPLLFKRGTYVLYIPSGSLIRCGAASRLFTSFLGQPNGVLPSPWRLTNQTATFSKAGHAIRSAFRVEPGRGAGPA
jgi:hypothetical protein